jgi:MFS superfamily sulfate permease-like transporter
VLIPGLLQQIPMAALGAMLIYTGTRLASPKEFMHVYHIGPEQLLLFVVTMMTTLATDILVGVAVGLVLKVILHVKDGVPLRALFRSVVSETEQDGVLTLRVQDAAIFTNYLGVKKRLANVPRNIRTVILDFEDTWVVDHTVLAKLQKTSRDWTQGQLLLTGLDGHAAASRHELAARRKLRSIGVAQGA